MGQHPVIDRRSILQVGCLGGLGLSLGNFFRLQAARADAKAFSHFEGTARSVIQIWLPGGWAQQETFDPKPLAPVEYRGDMKAIDTALAGVQFNELLSKTGAIADRLTVVRSMTHGEAAHERGTHNMFTGYRPSPALTFPSLGSVVSHELGPRAALPPYVCIPRVPAPDAGAGYLGSGYGPFSIGSDPADDSFKVRDLALPSGVDAPRFATRQRLRDVVGRHFQRLEESAENLAAMDAFYQRAYDLVSSADARAAFDIAAEPAAMRDRYGRNQAGQRMLLARRLVEAGVRFVTLSYGGWDMHQKIRDNMTRTLPPFDQAFAALITDLEQRGLLASTLVMVSSEFGRTPKINNDAGRDHWPKVFSVVLAGGGIRAGQVYGSSDAIAAEPADRALSIEDLATTVYHCLGIVAEKELMAPGNRPIEIVDGGSVRKDLLA
ncbi:MAG: DUF1501 domain-containing protein [Planctomycetes bacterium]|nr:DUF1501 domain-containing protein [Planctomycetota bacterium]MBM4056801.1 DUF1501 domain-containing protein [Planctomycetota bacterium]